MNTTTLTCPECGRTFLVTVAAKDRRRYCSRLCAAQQQACTKLHPKDVRAIRQSAATGVSIATLAQEYQITAGRITSIVLRRAWKDVE